MELILGIRGTDRDNPKKHNTRCPRCGYDQRGVVDSWKDACPLKGLCSECGLEFDWAELLSSKIRKPRWNVEYSRSIVAFPIVALTTLAMSFIPARFWSRLKMTHVFRPRRVIAYLALPLLLFYLVFAIHQGFTTYSLIKSLANINGTNLSSSSEWMITRTVLLPLSTRSAGSATITSLRYRQYWYYSGMTLVSENKSAGTVTVSLEAPVEMAARTLRYHHNISYWEVWPDLLIGSATNPFSGFHFKTGFLCVFVAAIHTLFCALGFVLLPMSRRQAKVRWSHIVRILLYSLMFVVVLIVVILCAFLFCDRWGWFNQHLYRLSRGVSLLVIPMGMVVWWACATKHYLKIPHGWGVGLSLSLIAYLTGPVLLFCFVNLLLN